MATDKSKLYETFEVIGAGRIEISKSPGWQCGGEEGFSFGVEWSRHPFIGGVIPKEEAIRLANFILERANDRGDTPQRSEE